MNKVVELLKIFLTKNYSIHFLIRITFKCNFLCTFFILFIEESIKVHSKMLKVLALKFQTLHK